MKKTGNYIIGTILTLIFGVLIIKVSSQKTDIRLLKQAIPLFYSRGYGEGTINVYENDFNKY